MNFLRRFLALFRRAKLDREMAEEMAAHLEREAEQNLARGLPPEEAHYAARRAFGGLDQLQERERDARGFRWLDDAWRDGRYGARALRKSPGFSAATITILALGIGGVTAMFSTLYTVMIRPLPYPEPDRLVLGRATFGGNINPWVSGADYADYRDQSQSFSALEAFFCVTREVTVTTGQAAERASSLIVGPGLFSTLGVNLLLGRSFTVEDGRDAAPPVAIVSHAFWQKHFAAQTDLAGRSLLVDGESYDIVGVAPPDFHFIHEADLYIPLHPMNLGPRRYHNWFLLGRLKPGVTLAAAQSDVDVISAQLSRAYPDTDADLALLLTPLQRAFTEQYDSGFGLLCAGAAAILLIACANAAGLLLARGVGRHGELAVRTALGASQGRIVRMLLAEALVLAGIAGVAGALLAVYLQQGLLHLMPIETLLLRGAGLSLPVLGFVLAITVLAGLGFGLLPAWRARRVDLARDLRSSGRGFLRHGVGLRRGLVIGQMAVSFVLLVVAGLLIRSLASLYRADLGFNPRNLLTVEVPLPPRDFPDRKRTDFFASLLANVKALPGVVSAAAVSQLPLRNPHNNIDIYAAAAPPPSPKDNISGYQRMVLPGYFRTMGIPLVAGRDILATDSAGSRRVVVISQRLAGNLFPHRDPLGQLVAIDRGNDAPWEVVGVVGDVKQSSLSEDSDSFGSFYRAHAQQPWPTMRLAIRTVGDPRGVVPSLRTVLQRMDPQIPLSGPRTMEEVMANTTVSEKAQTLYLATFSLLALTLATVGIFGLLMYIVTHRQHEIGIRMAVGATGRMVAWSVLREATALTFAGVLVGGIGALGVTRLLRANLYGVGPGDPIALATAAVALLTAAALAAWLPARRAARVDPMVALRAE
jgi:predicted permease